MTDQAGVTAVPEAAPVAVDPNAAPAEAAPETDLPKDGGKPKTGDPRVDDPWPNSARNKVSRLERKLAIERAERAETAKRLQALEAAQQKQASQGENKAPAEDDFETYGDFLQAQILHKLKGEQGQGKEKSVDPEQIKQQARQEAQRDLYLKERIEVAGKKIEKAQADIPGFQQLEDQYQDVLDELPDHAKVAFLETDSPELAFYALAKEGKLEQLAHMEPTKAAMEIFRAQIRGETMIREAKVSKAPPPINGVKGASSVTGGISPDSSYEELRKWRNS
jgi:hypothetical protein